MTEYTFTSDEYNAFLAFLMEFEMGVHIPVTVDHGDGTLTLTMMISQPNFDAVMTNVRAMYGLTN